MQIAVAGMGYVGLSLAMLLAQHNEVRALDVVPEKVALLNSGKSPIADVEIERFLREQARRQAPAELRGNAERARSLRRRRLRRYRHSHKLRPAKELLRHFQRRSCHRRRARGE